MQPVTGITTDADGSNDFLTKKGIQTAIGGAVSSAGPAVTRGLVGGYNWVKGGAQPLIDAGSLIAQRLRKTFNGNPAAGSDVLRNAPVHVPGSEPTTAQVLAQHADSPDAILLEKAMTNTQEGRTAMFSRQNANNTARVKYVKKIAGTDEDLQNAIDARNAAAAPYQAKLSAAQPVDPQPVLDHLDALATTSKDLHPDVKGAANSLKTELLKVTKPGPNGEPMISPSELNDLRGDALGHLKQAAGADGDVASQVKVFAPIKDTIAHAIEDAVPGYMDYIDQFAKDNVPINEMKLFRTLGAHENASGTNGPSRPVINLDRVEAAVEKASDPDAPITQEGKDALNNLQADLRREAHSSNADSIGGGAKPDIDPNSSLASAAFGPTLGGDGFLADIGGAAGRDLGQVAGAAVGQASRGSTVGAIVGKAAARMVGEKASKNVTEALVDAMMNPASAADALDKLTAMENQIPGKPTQWMLNPPAIAPRIGPWPSSSPSPSPSPAPAPAPAPAPSPWLSPSLSPWLSPFSSLLHQQDPNQQL